MNSEKAFDMLPYAVDIFDKLKIDEYVKENSKSATGKTAEEIENIKKETGLGLIKYILKNSAKVKEEFFSIVAIFEGITEEEAKKQGLAKTIKSIKSIFSDNELMDFFKGAM